jgi:hypothetical protein
MADTGTSSALAWLTAGGPIGLGVFPPPRGHIGPEPWTPASSDRDCRFDQREESSMIGRDLFNTPCRICRRPTGP